jgi:hypothetical protein
MNKELKKRRGQAALYDLQFKLDAEDLDPIIEMAKLAKNVNTPLAERIKILRDLAQYLHPKRRAVEIGNADDEGLVIRIKKFSENDSAESKLTDEGRKALLGDPDEETKT